MHVDYPERRRLVLAAILTLVALPALWLMSRDDGSGAPNVATAGIAVAAGGGTDGTEPGAADDAAALSDTAPVFLEGPAVRSSGIAEIAVPPKPHQEVRDARATYRSSLTPGTCLVPFVSTGTTLTIVNLDNNHSTTCVAIYSPASEVDDVVLQTNTFLELADLTDAPIPVEFSP
jgi:hypothetical protein